jgi:predicted transcriptional regulator
MRQSALRSVLQDGQPRTVRQIAAETGEDARQVNTVLRRVEGYGLVKCTPTRAPTGQQANSWRWV